MTEVSENFMRLAKAPGRNIYCKVRIGQREYYDDRIISFELRDIAHEDWFTIGAACPNEFEISLEHYDEPDVHTEVRPYISFDNIEWLPLGVFYIARRYFRGRFAKIFCYDKLYDLRGVSNEHSADALSRADLLLASVCGQAELPFSLSCATTSLPALSGYNSELDIIGYIAALNCSCATIDRYGRLTFKYCGGLSGCEISESDVFSASVNMTRAGIKGLRVNTGSGVITSGEGTGLSLVDIYDPFITQDTADSLVSQLSDTAFYGAEIEMRGLPFLEAGDIALFRGSDNSTIPIVLSEIHYRYDGGLTAKIYSRNKYNSDRVVHRQEFENALAYIWDYIGRL